MLVVDCESSVKLLKKITSDCGRYDLACDVRESSGCCVDYGTKVDKKEAQWMRMRSSEREWRLRPLKDEVGRTVQHLSVF